MGGGEGGARRGWLGYGGALLFLQLFVENCRL